MLSGRKEKRGRAQPPLAARFDLAAPAARLGNRDNRLPHDPRSGPCSRLDQRAVEAMPRKPPRAERQTHLGRPMGRDQPHPVYPACPQPVSLPPQPSQQPLRLAAQEAPATLFAARLATFLPP